VINTPAHLSSSVWNAPPIIVRSFFQKVHYLAYFIQIRDSEARGFSRSIVFVVANQCSSLIDWVAFGERPRLNSIVDKLQRMSIAMFPMELRSYAVSMKQVIDEDPEGGPLILSKYTELLAILNEGGLSIDGVTEQAEKRDYTFFTNISATLRPIRDLLDLRSLAPEIEEFVRSLPTHDLQTNVVSLAWNTPVGLGDDCLNSISYLMQSYENEQFLIRLDFLPKGILFDILFALFSGRSLTIMASKPPNAQSLAHRFSCIVRSRADWIGES
jgi:hypothetical protein